VKEKTSSSKFFNEIGEIYSISVEGPYKNIWENVALPVQQRKAHNHRLSDKVAEQCFAELSRRPSYLCRAATLGGVKNIAEVGTAQGLQFFSFAEYVKGSKLNGHVWSCDIKDERNLTYAKKYEDYTTFCLGNSENLSDILLSQEVKIDLFYIDGAHDRGDVIRDVYHLKRVQGENPIWIFDDFDKRFGCYSDIMDIMNFQKNHMVYKVGSAASGNPNHQVMVVGKF
jgi:hypothetical protein